MGGHSSHVPIGSVDRTVLTTIEGRLKTASYIRRTYIAIERGKPTLRADFDLHYLPPEVEEVYYDIRWYTSGDFEIHYQENWSDDREWKRRWDRHPRDGPRDHYHPPPDAGHPPERAEYPSNYYDVVRYIEEDTIDHIRTHPLLQHSS